MIKYVKCAQLLWQIVMYYNYIVSIDDLRPIEQTCIKRCHTVDKIH